MKRRRDRRRPHPGLVEDGHVTLTGPVRTRAEREEAERAAWRSAGVTSFTNGIHDKPK